MPCPNTNYSSNDNNSDGYNHNEKCFVYILTMCMVPHFPLLTRNLKINSNALL